MTQSFSVHIVDVFAEAPLAGNQLAVLPDAAGLSDTQMQAIAREMNFSETTFVTERGPDTARVRIFTPGYELPFAGHPTIGTAWVLTGGERDVTLQLGLGDVPVRYRDGVGWMTPPDVELGEPVAPSEVAALLQIEESALSPVWSARFAEVGPEFLLIGLADRDALARAEVSYDVFRQMRDRGLPMQSVFLFTDDAHSSDADFAARMYFDSAGLREDPATGSANAAFAAYLRDLDPRPRQVVVDQGVEMQRPSRLLLEIGEPIEVGGRVQPVLTGTLTI